jgi:hypothetical protein
VDAIVDSINQMNKISLAPEMTVQRWLSLGMVVVYLVMAATMLPTDVGQGSRDLARAVSLALMYFCLPLSLIWASDREDVGTPLSLLSRIAGWLFMAAPAVGGIALWMAE